MLKEYNLYKNLSLESLIGEKWVTIDGYPRYEVSNLGRVCRKEEIEQTNGFWDRENHTRRVSRKMLRQALVGGYLYVSLYSAMGENKRTVVVHRLVGNHFIKNPGKKPEINHKKGIKTDNRASELEWNTHGENLSHAYKTGLKKAYSCEDSSRTRLSNKQVLVIRRRYKNGESLAQLGRDYGYTTSGIWRIVQKISFTEI